MAGMIGIYDIIDQPLNSNEPSIEFKVRINILGEDIESDEIKKLQQKIKFSQRVRQLLSERDKDRKIPFHAYKK
ncbi:MAG: hypothetical protein ACFFDT_38610 [Candidatus Hodarchaeota archaeon]